MAKQISQETFDAAVKENIDEFEMEAEEALNDAVQQFEAQGVNLANIVKDLSLYTTGSDGPEGAKHPVVAAVEKLQEETSKEPVDKEEIQKCVRTIQAECDVDLARRCLAGKHNAYAALLTSCKKLQSDEAVLESLLSALCALSNGQPDLLDEEGITWNFDTLRSTDVNPAIASLLVKFMRLNCLKHETNRQKYVASDVVAILSSTINKFKAHASVLKEVCAAFRVLTYDDDVRVPFGKGHDHAKMIVTEENALKKIMDVCNDFKAHESLAELYQTLTSLAVRNEFCQEIMDLGGVKLMVETIEHNPNNQGLVKQVLSVLKTISGNDQVKVAIVEASGIELILSAMNQHARSAPIAEMGCAALTSLALRNPGHSNRIMVASGAETVVKAMQIHGDQASVQKQACMAVRNIVARCREHSHVFIELGVEDLIRTAMRRHHAYADEAKAALRDLELKVELRELWTGEGKGVHA